MDEKVVVIFSREVALSLKLVLARTKVAHHADKTIE